jgi:hypothetical protein
MFFFGPVVIVVGIVLAQALGDSFPLVDVPNLLYSRLMNWIQGDQTSIDGDQLQILLNQTTRMGPSHPQTRITLLLLFLASLGAMWTLINCLVMLFPGSVSSKGVLESRDDYEVYPIEPKSETATAPVPSTSALGGAGKNGGEGWRFQPSGTSTIIDERASRSITSAAGFSGGGPWERYGPATAMSAKRSFARVVRRYQHLRLISTPFPVDEDLDATQTQMTLRKPCGRVVLPPVFNLLAWLLGTIPATVIRIVKSRGQLDVPVSDDAGLGRVESIPEEDEHDGPTSRLSGGGLVGSLTRRWRRGRLNETAERWEGVVTRVVWRLVVGLPGLVVGGVRIWK